MWKNVDKTTSATNVDRRHIIVQMAVAVTVSRTGLAGWLAGIPPLLPVCS